ncbi:MAG: ribulose-phosphate 3-epimerase, partial [Candidatus Spechtbacterales bacterium]|nr:ribulose-phosphate 3-epimerase [Candidatus Spechtbacterales bacterium]
FTEKVNAVENLVNWVQLDVADGNFAPSTSWGDPVAIHNFDPGVFMEAHLMVSEPENVIDEWITGESEEGDSGIKRIFFHYEATSKHEEILEKIKNAGKEAGIAILPETPVHLIEPFAGLLDAVLIFSGNLGFYGGKFNEEASISKISTLRNKYPDITIEVDGGMNPETAKKVVDAGANAIVSGSYIWGSKDIKEAIDQLQNAVTL